MKGKNGANLLVRWEKFAPREERGRDPSRRLLGCGERTAPSKERREFSEPEEGLSEGALTPCRKTEPESSCRKKRRRVEEGERKAHKGKS